MVLKKFWKSPEFWFSDLSGNPVFCSVWPMSDIDEYSLVVLQYRRLRYIGFCILTDTQYALYTVKTMSKATILCSHLDVQLCNSRAGDAEQTSQAYSIIMYMASPVRDTQLFYCLNCMLVNAGSSTRRRNGQLVPLHMIYLATEPEMSTRQSIWPVNSSARVGTLQDKFDSPVPTCLQGHQHTCTHGGDATAWKTDFQTKCFAALWPLFAELDWEPEITKHYCVRH